MKGACVIETSFVELLAQAGGGRGAFAPQPSADRPDERKSSMIKSKKTVAEQFAAMAAGQKVLTNPVVALRFIEDGRSKRACSHERTSAFYEDLDGLSTRLWLMAPAASAYDVSDRLTAQPDNGTADLALLEIYGHLIGLRPISPKSKGRSRAARCFDLVGPDGELLP